MLAVGTTLGPYRILAPLGAGGMGEVYRAYDTRLGRDVAIKVIPAGLARDPERIRRFEQEARAAGALNHPNVCAIYDLGTYEGSPFVVMELLEGESLRTRLEAGSVAARKAIDWAAQAAHGLGAAHEKGIVHRDLKPENLFVTKDGRVKVLDFGLAKLTRPEVLAPAGEAPISIAATATGALLGTVGYMAPEQVRGESADARSDLFALGTILYESLTGERAFHGASYVETLHAILNGEPAPLTAGGREFPPGLEPILRHCLEKNPEERFQSARDLAFDLEGLSGSAAGRTSAGPQAAGVPARGNPWERLAWGIALAVAAIAIIALVAPRLARRQPEPVPVRFAVTAPAGETVVPEAAQIAISPDGRRMAFTVVDSAGSARLCVRSLESLAVRLLPGTEGSICPFWSPDNRFIAFFAGGKLKKIPVGGGPPEVICDAPDGRGGSWSKGGVIVFAPLSLGPLRRVSADGGEAVVVARPDSGGHETGLRFPCFLPDGRHFLYVSLPRKQAGFDVYVGALDSRDRGLIMNAGSAPIYAEPGCLLFVRGGRLLAQRFDRFSLRLAGQAIPLGDSPPVSAFESAPRLSASATGVLVHPAASVSDTRLVWLDRAGRLIGTIPIPPGRYEAPALSPDGLWAAVNKPNSPTSSDLWKVDLKRAMTTRLTFDDLASPGAGYTLVGDWSPDGRRIAVQYNRSGSYDVYQVLTTGTGRPEPLVQSDVALKAPATWSPDGRYLVFSQDDEATGWDLWLLPLRGDRKPVPYLRTPFNEITATISPDGRWLAYDSDETGTPEIYVRSFPAPGEKYRVTTSGGTAAKWSKDGRELLIWTNGQYLTTYGPVFSVSVETTPSFRAGTPRVLFTPSQDLVGITATRDLKRFLAVLQVAGAAPPSITVTLNWQTALKR
jgi:eukaryotic-like serine/threonine-protein kinase